MHRVYGIYMLYRVKAVLYSEFSCSREEKRVEQCSSFLRDRKRKNELIEDQIEEKQELFHQRAEKMGNGVISAWIICNGCIRPLLPF